MANFAFSQDDTQTAWYTSLWNGLVIVWGYLISFRWVVDLARWMIKTAGTISESAFMLATVYVTLNSVAHLLVSWLLPEQTIATLNQISVIAFSILPELIILSALKKVYEHWRMWFQTGRKRWNILGWAIGYSLPTLSFVTMTVITIVDAASSGMSGQSFQATGLMLVIRCLSGWWYSLVNMLFAEIGKRGYSEIFDKLAATNAQLKAEMAAIQSELDAVCNEKEAAIREKTALHTALTQTSESALQAYGDNVIGWLNSLDKTVDIDDIAAHTGINKRRLQNALERGEMQIKGTNKSRIWVPSLREYLAKNAPKNSTKERETGPMLKVVEN